MPPRTYKGKRPAGSSSRFNTERFRDAECAARFKSSLINRTIIFERLVVHRDLTSTRFLHWLNLNRCMILMDLNDECFEDWVQEFYCNIYDVTSNGFKTYIQGKTLKLDANKIATLLNLGRPSPISYPFYDHHMTPVESNEVAAVLCDELTEWRTPMKITNLTIDYRMLNTFVCNNIEPTSHSSDLLYTQALLLYLLGTCTFVDIHLRYLSQCCTFTMNHGNSLFRLVQ